MSYTLIEDLVEHNDNQAKYPKMSSDTTAWRQSLNGRPQYPPQIDDTQFYKEPPKQERTPIKDVVNTNVNDNNPTPSPAPSTNEAVMDYLRRVGLYMRETTNYFSEKEKAMSIKLQLLEQLLKGIGIIVIILLVFLMVKK